MIRIAIAQSFFLEGMFWAAGEVASPAGRWLGAPCDPAGRVSVSPDLSVPDHAGVFAIGDTASSKAWQGRDVPGLAPAAKQAGKYVARTIAARVSGRAASTVDWNGSSRTTTYQSATQLTAAITAADVASAGSVPITVVNPTLGGGSSSAVTSRSRIPPLL